MLGMVAGASFPVRSWGLLLPWHLFLELPREFLLSGICCSTSGSTEGAIGDRLFRTQEADAVHISMWVACQAPYTSVHLVCLRQPQCERLERVAPQKPLVSGGHIIRVPSIYLSQSFPNVPLRIGKIYMFPNILWSVMQRAQFSSVAQLCLTLCDPMDCSTPTPTSWSLFKLMTIKSVIPSNHLILCRLLLLLPSTFPSIRVFSNESSLWIR